MGLSQAELAEVGDVTRNSQGSYERGQRPPDVRYLERIAAAGADVVYILTGVRSPGLTLSPDEAALLDNFRECEEVDRSALRQLAMRSAEARRLKTKTRPRPGNPPETQAAL